MDETIILKDTELYILLAAAGMSGVPGFQRNEETGRETIPYIIHEMVRKQVLFQEGDALVPAASLQQVVHALKGAPKVLVFENENEKGQAYIYVNDDFVLLEDSLHEANAVRLGLLTEDVCLEYLGNYFYQEDVLAYPEELVRQTLEEENGILRKRVTLYEFESGMLGREKIRWCLYEGKYNKYMEITTEEKTERIKYSEWRPDHMLQKSKESVGGSRG